MSSFITLRSGIPYLVSVAGLGAAYDQYVSYGSDQTSGFNITLPSGQTYNLGQNELQVFLNGEALISGLDYAELSTTQITLNRNVTAGSIVRIRR